MRFFRIYFLFVFLFSVLLSICTLLFLDRRTLKLQHLKNIQNAKNVNIKFNNLFSELQRNAKVMGTLSQVIKTATGELPPDNPYIIPALLTTKQQLNASIIYLMNGDGDTVACSPYGLNDSKTLTGNNYKFRPYFQKAIKGESDIYLALGVTTNKRGIYYSAPVYDKSKENVVGALVIKKGLKDIKHLLFNQKNGIFMLVSEDGVVFASNKPSWLFRTVLPITKQRLVEIRETKQFASKQLPPISTLLNSDNVSLDNIDYEVIKNHSHIKNWYIYSLLPKHGIYPYRSTYMFVFIIFTLTFTILSYIHALIHKNKLQQKVKIQNVTLKSMNKNLKVEIEKQKKTEISLIGAKEHAEIAVQSKSQFLANMSHELRTPMNGVLGMKNLLLETKLNTEQHEYIVMMMESARSLLKVLNDILDFSKMEAGKLTLEDIPLNLKNSVDSIIKVMTISAEDKGIKLYHHLQSDLPYDVLGDPERLKQVLVNILGNAIKFTQEGEINVYVFGQRKNASQYNFTFEIIDTGVGMSNDSLRSIFNKFTQADQSTTRKFGGTGLGLTITKELIDIMGGTINVVSELNKGSKFLITIPLTIDNSKLEDAPNLSPINNKSFDNLKILLVEDNIINQKVASKILQNLNCTVEFAINGVQAVDMSGENRYDIIFMDCQMPEMNGYQATKAIRDREKGSFTEKVVIIAMTANAMTGDREKCLDVGMDDFLPKPIKKQDIINMLEKYS